MGIIMIKCPQTGRAIPTGIKKLSMQCGVLRAHPLLNLPDQSRPVRQGRLGLRAECR